MDNPPPVERLHVRQARRRATVDHDNLSKVDQFKLLTETAAGTDGHASAQVLASIAVAEQLEKGRLGAAFSARI
jgi:hypothetical protein